MSDLGSRTFRLRVLWLLLAAGLLTALPAMRGEILVYDDVNLLRGPGGAFERSPGSFFSDLYYYAYLPFYGLSYWIDGKLSGNSEVMLHFGNVVWHVAACYLVFCVLGLLLGDRMAALFGALVFCVHPVHVESVAWISGRKEVLSGFLLFLAWLLHLRERRVWAVAVFLMASFTKATAVVLPLLLLAAALLLPLYEHRRRRAALATLPFFVAALLPAAVHLMVGARTGVVGETGALGARLWSGVHAWGISAWHALAPGSLSIDYPEAAAPSVSSGLAGLGWLVLALVAAWFWRRRRPVAAFGIVAFFAALLPHNNVFPATDVQLADRYLYIALFGAAALFSCLAAHDRGRVALGIYVLALVVVSSWSASRFSSDEELWTRTIAARDDSALAYYQRAYARFAAYKRTTPPDEALRRDALADYEASLSRAGLLAHKVKAHAGLVLPLIEENRAEQALEHAGDALALLDGVESDEAPALRAQILFHRGIARKQMGDHAMAGADFKASGALRPRYEVFYEQGIAWWRAARPDEAREAFERAASLDRGNEEPWLWLANVARMAGDLARYKRALEQASSRAPKSAKVAEGWVKYWLYGPSPNYRRAREVLAKLPQKSRRRGRLEAEVEAQHAVYLFRRGKLKQAVKAADSSRRLGLGNVSDQYDLGQIYLEAGRYDDAVKCFHASADVLSKRPIHREAVARAYALKAHALLTLDERARARAAMRAALDAQPDLIVAGAVPLRGEIALLRKARTEDLLLLAAAAVAGDPQAGRMLAGELLEAKLPDADRALVYRLRGLMRAFVTVDFEGAEEDLRQVLERDAHDRWARYRLAQVWIKAGSGWLRTADLVKSERRRAQGLALVRKAIDTLGTLLEEDPAFHYARLLRGQAYFALDDPESAKTDYVHVREKDPTIKEVLVHEAALHRLSFVKGGSIETLDHAQNFLVTALRLDPNYFHAIYELGNVFHLRYDAPGIGRTSRREAFVKAVLWYRRAMALNPRARAPRLEWARLLLKAGQEAIAGGEIERAHQLIERLEAEAADVADVHKERARLNLLPDFGARTSTPPDKLYRAVARALDRVERLSPKDPALPALRSAYHRSRGESYFLSWGKYMTAAKMAREGERTDPQRARLFGDKADRAKQLASEQWKLALQVWPEDPGNAAIRDRLRTLDPKFIEADQEQARKAWERGRAAYDAGSYREAARAFGQATRLFPEWIDLRYFHAMSLARAGLVDKAKPELERVANHTEGSRFPEVMFELGNLFRAQKNPLVARVWYQRFVRTMKRTGRGKEPAVDLARKLLEESR